ncbi:MAG: isocitrate/isopropylmalate dehydrogenase family protein [Bdellovibrionales bacterium]|nr:isocitrate/isopropylmalate dehydrogenase family protein [Bdellovibrionales bacterium]
MSHQICLLPGDGIGPEVTRASTKIIDATGVKIDWIELDAGGDCAQRTGELLPQSTLDAIEKYRIALKGPIATPVGKGFRSINVSLRKHFGLYAAVRPVYSLKGVQTRYEDVDLVVIRENTEGLYSGIEHEVVPGVVESLKVATEKACTRIAEFAFDYAVKNGRKKVTAFHKANILKMSDGLFVDCARKVHEKSYQGKVEFDDLIIDNACMQMVKDPTQFDVLLLENLYGDVVSDLCAGLVGGLGVVSGANFGPDCAIFEAVHGSAPDIAGKGVANPLACLMSGVSMLEYIGEKESATKITKAFLKVLESGEPAHVTRDIGGTANTEQFVSAILSNL